MGTHKKLNYIHIFRALAIIMIVAGHCFGCRQPLISATINTLLKDGTVFFVFIAGFLFQYLSDNFSYAPYLKKKFFNVVSPYLITSVVGISAMLLYPKSNPFAGVNKLIQIGMFLTTGRVHNLPTWYIPMTCIFFLFAPLLIKLEKKFLNNSLLFLCLSALLLFSCLCPRPETDVFVTSGLSAYESYIGYLKYILFSTMLFFPVYVLGMFLAARRNYISKLYENRFYLWSLFGGSSMVSFYFIYQQILPGRLLLPKIFLTLLLLAYLEHYDCTFSRHTRLNAALGTIATYSFSIFFLHYYFIIFLNQIFIKILHWDIYLSAESFNFYYWLVYKATSFIIAFFGSLFMAILIKKFLEKIGVKHTRFFIGA